MTPAEIAAARPKPFDAAETAAGLFDRAKTDLPGQAKPFAQVLPAVQSDPKAAAETYKAVSPGENSYVFPVTATGTVSDGTPASLRLAVSGLDTETPVIVPLTTAINGAVLRDAMGFKFADAPGQTDYQYVGDELKKLMQAEVSSEVSDPGSLKGKKITVVGVINVLATGGPQPKAKPVNIQPLSIKVGS